MMYSWGVGVKMSLVLALPAVGIVLLQAMGLQRALRQAFLMSQLQVGRIITSDLLEADQR